MTDLGKIKRLCKDLQDNFNGETHMWGDPSEIISKIVKIAENMQTRNLELEKPVVQEPDVQAPFQKIKMSIKIAAEISAKGAVSIVKQIIENGKIFTVATGHKNLITNWLDDFIIFSFKPSDTSYTFSIIPRKNEGKDK